MNKKLKNCLINIAIPIIVFAVFSLIVLIKGKVDGTKSVFLFKEGLKDYNLTIFIQTLVKMGLICFAVSMNVPNGRFDFSVGSIMILSVVVGGNLAMRMGLNSFGMLICFMVCGATFGAIAGGLYVALRLPAMVTSLGITLIYEGVATKVFDGALKNVSDVSMGDQSALLVMFLIVTLIMYYLYGYTKFGHDKKALMNNPKIAVDAGINEKFNAILCFAFSGILMGLAGMVELKQKGTITASTGMSTLMTMFQGFLALFIGQYLARKGNFVVGMFVGAIVAALINSFVSVMFPSSSQLQSIINALILLAFLIFEQKTKTMVKRDKPNKKDMQKETIIEATNA